MLRRLICALLLALLLAGCGHVTRVAPTHAIELGLSEYRITPQHVQARAGQLSILAHNYGRLIHNLVLSAGGHTVATTKPIPPGQSRWLFVDLLPGDYLMASNLFDDQALGTYGTLTVTP